MTKVVCLFSILVLITVFSQNAFSANPALKSFDDTMIEFMRKNSVPGGALAVLKDGRLVYAQGYGFADRENQIPVTPLSLFRIASISKPVTSAAVFTLIQNNKLSLDTRAFSYLSIKPVEGEENNIDPRLNEITIRELLQHTAGWDRAENGDPMFKTLEIAGELNISSPAKPNDIIRYMIGKSLDFDPGSRYCYSNFGYCVLGRIIEKASGMTYEEYVKTNVLLPIGIKRMQCGKSLLADRAPGEVCYYMRSEVLYSTVFPGLTPPSVPEPYGAFSIEAMDSHGGWIASAVDLARFASLLDHPSEQTVLRDDSLKEIYKRPPAPAWIEEDGKLTDYYYGCGWLVRPVGNKANYWHAGVLPGAYSLLVRRHDGLSWVVLFNECTIAELTGYGDIDMALHHAAAHVTEWPSGNMFKDYE